MPITWVLEKLEALKDERMVLVRDPLRLLPEEDGNIHRFANDNRFTVVIASTNLVFRELFEKISAIKGPFKLLVIDRCPAGRRQHSSISKAPPPFYPDFLSQTSESARIDVNLRQFLIEKTGDPHWPKEANDPQFARMIINCLEGVLKAHENLRAANTGRFTDYDFKTIVAFSALGVPEAAFKHLEVKTCWKICILGHQNLEEIDSIAPEVAHTIRDELRKVPPPFRWFADHPPDLVIRAFYLSAILSQHFEHWNLLLANIDSNLKPFSEIKIDLIQKAAPELVLLDKDRAHDDLSEIENSISKDALALLLLEQMKITEAARFAEVIKNEQYSTLISSLALLTALDDLVFEKSPKEVHQQILGFLSRSGKGKTAYFIESRPSIPWANLKNAYELAGKIMEIKNELSTSVKNLKVKEKSDLSYKWFRSVWNEKRVNRLEYYLSSLERLAGNADFLPRRPDDLPPAFVDSVNRIRGRIRKLTEETQALLGDFNSRFQELMATQYRSWVNKDSEVRLTSQFLRRCVKPNWDHKTEKAVIFIFDGMRYDIWEEMLRPIFEDRMELIEDYPASSLLPSETQVSRKAICAGAFPDSFNMKAGEDRLLKEGLSREFEYKGEVEVITPEGMGTGETVRYRAGNLDLYIFELCDKELHKIKMKTLQDGRQVPERPLAFIYQQHIKNIIDTEVMAIVRSLPPDTKVFITADHGFGSIGRERINLETYWLNEPADCYYGHALMKTNLAESRATVRVRQNTLEFQVKDFKMPDTENATDRETKQQWQKKFTTIIFPKTGYALSRPRSPFNPEAYSHGGISIQEVLVPMIVMRVKSSDEKQLLIDEIIGPKEIIEGEEAEFRVMLQLAKTHSGKEIKVEAQASYGQKQETAPLPQQIMFITDAGSKLVYRFTPDPNDISDEEHRKGMMVRILKIDLIYRDGKRTIRRSRTFEFSMRLNPQNIVRRVPTHLGKILGLTPKSIRG